MAEEGRAWVGEVVRPRLACSSSFSLVCSFLSEGSRSAEPGRDAGVRSWVCEFEFVSLESELRELVLSEPLWPLGRVNDTLRDE